MGDRLGNIRWWDVTTGQSSAFNSHRDGIRRIKFSPVVTGDRSRGRVAVLFNDNTFSVFDLVSLKRIRYFPSIYACVMCFQRQCTNILQWEEKIRARLVLLILV